jgi:hypothetical protein
MIQSGLFIVETKTVSNHVLKLLTPSLSVTIALIFLSSVTGWAGPITVGSFLFGNPLTTAQGFEVYNSTGPTNGCDAPDSIPVCTVLVFENTSLVVTLDDGSTITRTPSGGFSFGPGGYIYGDNVGDDQNNSFLFDDSLNIVSATFSGDVTPASFLITDSDSSGNLSTFFSGATFTVALDLSSAPSLAGDVITVDEAQASSTPEPSTGLFILSFPIAWLGARRPGPLCTKN